GHSPGAAGDRGEPVTVPARLLPVGRASRIGPPGRSPARPTAGLNARAGRLFAGGAGSIMPESTLGEVPERSNGPVSKTGVRATVPRVRIPPSPLSFPI